jgi:hypothetical protein
MTSRRALLDAALGFLQLRDQPREVTLLRRWLDSWAGLGDVIVGLTRQGLDLELRQFPLGWRANLYPTGTANSIVVASAWEARPWRAVQQAGWMALTQPAPRIDVPPQTLARIPLERNSSARS